MKEKSTFVEFFGDYPIIRVIDFLLTYRDFDYNKKEIARNADVSWNTLQLFWKQLEDKKVVLRTRKVGKSQMYKLNTENPIVQQLLVMDKKLMLHALSKMKEKIAVRV